MESERRALSQKRNDFETITGFPASIGARPSLGADKLRLSLLGAPMRGFVQKPPGWLPSETSWLARPGAVVSPPDSGGRSPERTLTPCFLPHLVR
jgi:hypothetical protein